MATFQAAEKFFLQDVGGRSGSVRLPPAPVLSARLPLTSLRAEQLELARTRALRRHVRGNVQRTRTSCPDGLPALIEGELLTRARTDWFPPTQPAEPLFGRQFNSTDSFLPTSSLVGGDGRGVRMTGAGSNKLYRSQPHLTGERQQQQLSASSGKLPDIKCVSVPDNMNLYSGESSSRLPSISDSSTSSTVRGQRRRRSKAQVGDGGGFPEDGSMESVVVVVGGEPPDPAAPGLQDREEDADRRPEDLSRAEVERMAEEEVKHNWLLEEENKIRIKRFENRKNRLMIHISDDDTLEAIDDRLHELRLMAKPRKDERHVLDRLSLQQRQLILRMRDTPISVLRKTRRKGWKPIQKFRWAANIVLLLSKGLQQRRQYHVNKAELGQIRRRLDQEPQTTTVDAATSPSKSSLGPELLLALTMQPHLRDNKTVKRILWLLRATKAFKNLFPAEMEMELAKVVGYERYDDGRILCHQGRPPDRFYYIISGRIGQYRQYKLSTGQVTKGMGFITKGMTTDPEELEKRWQREDSLVAKGQVEVLIIDRDAYSYLQHTTVGPPLDFLRSLDLFEEFPVERFNYSNDAIEYTYYGYGKLIVQDSNRTPWLHVVKSGLVKVVRLQTVIDARSSNESKFVSPRIEALGCGKLFSHADAMIGAQAKQKKTKAQLNVNLPRRRKQETRIKGRSNIARPGTLVSNPLGGTLGVAVTAPSSDGGGDGDDGQSHHDDRPQSSEEREEYRSPSPKSGEQVPSPCDQGQAAADALEIPPEAEVAEYDGKGAETGDLSPTDGGDTGRLSASQRRRRKDAVLPIINIPTRDETDDFRPHALWLTRERTDADVGPLAERRGRKEQAERPAYLQLGVLNPGDVFGLDHMQPALASEAVGVSLLSDGAEVVKISKRFFLQNAGNNTMLKVETMCNEYMSEEEARRVLYDTETWSQYKTALWQRMTAMLPQPASSR